MVNKTSNPTHMKNSHTSKQSLLLFVTSIPVKRDTSVSYTHLDVYKRQTYITRAKTTE